MGQESWLVIQMQGSHLYLANETMSCTISATSAISAQVQNVHASENCGQLKFESDLSNFYLNMIKVFKPMAGKMQVLIFLCLCIIEGNGESCQN